MVPPEGGDGRASCVAVGPCCQRGIVAQRRSFQLPRESDLPPRASWGTSGTLSRDCRVGPSSGPWPMPCLHYRQPKNGPRLSQVGPINYSCFALPLGRAPVLGVSSETWPLIHR